MATIQHLNERPMLVHTGPYVDYASANYELSENLTGLISDCLEYGKAKAKSAEFAEKLQMEPSASPDK